MKMLKVGLILLSVCFVLFGSVQVQAATWYASSGASGSGASASDPGDFESLITSSAAGDALVLAAGTYTVSATGIKLDHALTITGAGMGSTILNCAAATVACFEMDSSTITTVNTVIQTLTFQDGGDYQLEITNGSPTITSVEFTGTIVAHSSLISFNGHPIIKNSVFSVITGNNAIGIDPLATSGDGVPKLISGCTFTSSKKNFISLINADTVILKNTFDGGGGGQAIQLNANGGTSSAVVYDNTFKNNKTGVSIDAEWSGTGNNTIKGNRFISNQMGIISISSSSSVDKSVIDSNQFVGNTDPDGAIFLQGTANTIINNLFNGNNAGIFSSYGGTNTIAFNTIAKGTGDGIELVDDQSLIVNNNISSNSGYGISVDAKSTAAQLGGNNTFGNTLGTISGTYVDLGGNLNTAPKFKTGTFKPSATSPLINAAISTYTIGYDITGKIRTTPDIGAYEY